MSKIPPLLRPKDDISGFTGKKPEDMSDDIAFVNGGYVVEWIFNLFSSGKQPVSPVTGTYLVKVDISRIPEPKRVEFLEWFAGDDFEEKFMWLGRQMYLYTGNSPDRPLADGNPLNYDDLPKFVNWLFGLVPDSKIKSPFAVQGGRRKKTRRRVKTYG